MKEKTIVHTAHFNFTEMYQCVEKYKTSGLVVGEREIGGAGRGVVIVLFL